MSPNESSRGQPVRVVIVLTPFLGAIHGSGDGGRADHPDARSCGRSNAPSIAVAGIDETAEQGWKGYAVAVARCSASSSIVVLYVLLRLQDVLPLNQNGLRPRSRRSPGFNTSVSFETNTNWQNYAGESAMTHLTQAAGLAVRNFTSAGVGHRGRHRPHPRPDAPHVGDHRQLLGRPDPRRSSTSSCRSPSSARSSWSGRASPRRSTARRRSRHARGCAADHRPRARSPRQEIIKELGNNGGGFLNANSAHPFENPTALTNWLEMVAILVIPFALTVHLRSVSPGTSARAGRSSRAMAARPRRRRRSSRWRVEARGNPLFPAGVDQAARQHGGQGDSASGPAAGGLWAAVTTGTSTGAVNAMHDSLQPIGGLVPLFNMQLGEITPGGVGAGLYGMLVIGAILAVFIAGLMVGRTPEYLGKKVEAFEMKMAMLVVLVLGASILGFTALSPSSLPRAWRARSTPARTASARSCTPSPARPATTARRSRGLTGNTPFYNITGGAGDAHRPLRDDHPDPRHRRLDGRQAPRRAVARAPSPRPDALFVGLLIGVDRHRRRPDLLPGARARTDRRAAPPERREAF